jgi:hypothetical protein
MTAHRIQVLMTIALAIIAALFLSFVLFLFGTVSLHAPMPAEQQATAPVNEVAILEQMSPPPASAATITKESKTLNAVSKTSANSGGSLTEQQKLDTLSGMGASH